MKLKMNIRGLEIETSEHETLQNCFDELVSMINSLFTPDKTEKLFNLANHYAKHVSDYEERNRKPVYRLVKERG